MKAREFASRFNDGWFIISAKHGLVSPDETLKPYDESLVGKPASERKKWANRVFQQLRNVSSIGDEITIIAGQDYREFLMPLLRSAGYQVVAPTEGLSIGRTLRWLNAQLVSRSRFDDVIRFYELIGTLEKYGGGKRTMKDCTGKRGWPERGVYFFFEPQEFRTLHPSHQRVVRIGTHGVSKGSRSTLWHRLRTHKGTEFGTGNHRGSIFRLHVGMAIIYRDGDAARYPNWGQGQSAPPGIRKSEEGLERKVSQFIGEMSILHLKVEDDTGPGSDRAYLERNAIALLAGKIPADKPSKNWLGSYSPNPTIRKTGIWNLDHVSRKYQPEFLEILEQYVAVTVGRIPHPSRSIAPKNWRTTGVSDEAQGELFEGMEAE